MKVNNAKNTIRPIVRVFIPIKGSSVNSPCRLIKSEGPEPKGLAVAIVFTFKGRKIVETKFNLNCRE